MAMPSKMVGFSKSKSTDKVWAADVLDEAMESMGEVYFSFDKKTIYNYWTDYGKLSDRQKWLFDDAFPFWATFGVTSEETKAELKKEHPNWKRPDDLENEDVIYDLVDVNFVTE